MPVPFSVYLRSANLSSFGVPAAGKYVEQGDTSVFNLEGTLDGSDWATIPSDQYYVVPHMGYVVERGTDDSGNGVDLSIYQSLRVTYVINDNGIETAYSQEPVTFSDEANAYAGIGSDGRMSILQVGDTYFGGIVYAQGFISTGSGGIPGLFGPKAPGSAADDSSISGVAWSNVSNITADDDTEATAALTAGGGPGTAGPNNFATAALGTGIGSVAWTNKDNALTSNDSYATAALAGSSNTNTGAQTAGTMEDQGSAGAAWTNINNAKTDDGLYASVTLT